MRTQAVVVPSLLSATPTATSTATSTAELEQRDMPYEHACRATAEPPGSGCTLCSGPSCRSLAAAARLLPSRVRCGARYLDTTRFWSPAWNVAAIAPRAAYHALFILFTEGGHQLPSFQQGPLRHRHKRIGRLRQAGRVHHRCAHHHTHQIVNWKCK